MPLESVGDTPQSFDDPSLSWAPSNEPAPAPSPGADSSGDAKPAASSSEATTVPPVESTPADAKPRESSGPIPFERHKAILEDERKLREAVEAKWQRVAWASQLTDAGNTPEQVQRALAIEGGLRGNTVAFIEQLLTEAAGNPGLTEQVRSIAARVLGTGRQTADTPDPNDAEPQPDYFTQHEDGSRTPFYSGPQLQKWHEWSKRQQEAAMNARFAPLEQVRRDIEQQKADADTQARYDTEYRQHLQAGSAVLDKLKQEPYFNDSFLAAMRTYMESQQWKATVEQAWLHVLTTKTLPTLSQTERAATIADLRTKATASSVNPKAAVSGVPVGPKGFYDPNLKW